MNLFPFAQWDKAGDGMRHLLLKLINTRQWMYHH